MARFYLGPILQQSCLGSKLIVSSKKKTRVTKFLMLYNTAEFESNWRGTDTYLSLLDVCLSFFQLRGKIVS